MITTQLSVTTKKLLKHSEESLFGTECIMLYLTDSTHQSPNSVLPDAEGLYYYYYYNILNPHLILTT